MPPLAELQAYLRDAVVLGRNEALGSLLTGGHDPLARLDVHRRHYETSLADSILTKFPAAVWLLGETYMRAIAGDFVRGRPPSAPCIAEYAGDFPDFLQNRPEIETRPYAAWLARLDWLLGKAACAVDAHAIGMGDLAALGVDSIADLVLTLQRGTFYLEAPWPVDDLARLHVTESAPDRYEIAPATVFLQVHGSRGSFTIGRLDPGTFVFREAIASSVSIGDAAERALMRDGGFDPGGALAGLVAEGMAIAVHHYQRDRT